MPVFIRAKCGQARLKHGNASFLGRGLRTPKCALTGKIEDRTKMNLTKTDLETLLFF